MINKKLIFQHYFKVKFSFFFAILIVVFVGIFAALGHHRLKNYISSLEQTGSIIQEIRGIKRVVSDVQLGVRGYLITGDSSFLTAYNEAVDISETHIQNLERATTTSSTKYKRVTQIKKLLDSILQDNALIVNLETNGNRDEAYRKMASSKSVENTNNIRRLLFDLEREESNTQQTRLSDLDRSIEEQRNTLYLGFGLGIVLLLFSWLFVLRTLKQKDKAEAELNHFFLSSPDLFCIVGLDANFKRINPVFEELLGYRLSDIMNKSFLELVHPEDRELTIKELSSLKTTLKPSAFESRHLCADGSFKWFSWKTTIVPESSVFYGVARDITDKKILEQENISARKAAMAASEAKSQFLANMSHEIRTPMNGVIGMTKLLLDSPLNTDQKDHTESILISAQNLLMIINDILDFSKIEAGKMNIEKVEFDLNAMLIEIERSLRLTVSQKSITFNIEKIELATSVIGDSARIRQVLLNLLSNAIKFTHEGGVNVYIDTLSDVGSDLKLKFSVVDTGIGLSEKAVLKMFRAFSQANYSTSRKFGGTGLGLSICKQLVELMGGQIGIKSTEGVGSTFWFEISFVKGRELGLLKSLQKVNLFSAHYSGHVLVADDNEINRKVISGTLTKLGLKVDLAENGKQVIAALDKNPLFNLVFLDCHMPEMDGYDTTAHIRSNINTAYTKIPIVALTANAMVGEREKCIQLGFTDFLIKPIEDNKLHEVLRKYLEKTEIEFNKETLLLSEIKMSTEAADSEDSSVINIKILETLEDLQVEGEPDIVVELIHSFLKQTPSRINSMATAIATNNFEVTFDEAHTIKSSARTMGAKMLGEICQKIENRRGENDPEKVKSLFEKMQNEYNLIASELLAIAQTRSKKNKVA